MFLMIATHQLILNCSSFTSYTGNRSDQIPDLIVKENSVNNGLVSVRFAADLLMLRRSNGFQIHYETSMQTKCNNF